VLIVVTASSCGSNKQQEPDLDFGLPGGITENTGFVTQCRSDLITQNETESQYRNTYFTIGLDGTETIQSQVVGPTPCP
jgi:hypothetical protein